jgi:hypothetical protein
LASVYGGLYGNNAPLNSGEVLFARVKNCAAVRIKDVHLITASFNGAEQNFTHISVEGSECKELILQDYTVSNYGSFGSFLRVAANVPAGAWRDTGVQFNLGGPEPANGWVSGLSNAQYSELRVRKLLDAAKVAGSVSDSGRIFIDNAGNCIFKV